MTKYGGAVAACGLARAWTCRPRWRPSSCAASRCSASTPSQCPLVVRHEAWRRLASELDRGKLGAMTDDDPLRRGQDVAARILDGKVRGRVVVEIG